MSKGIWVYDIENYINFTCFTFLDALTPRAIIDKYIAADIANDKVAKEEVIKQMNVRRFVMFGKVNHADSLSNFIYNEVAILVGYNSYKYDDIITDYICMNSDLSYKVINERIFKLSQDIIKCGDLNFRWQDPFKHYDQSYRGLDLMKMLYLDKKKVSLKQVSIILKWHRVQSLPIPFSAVIKPEEVVDILDYNLNDVLITYELYWKKIEDIRLRLGISKHYGIDVLSESRSSIANKILTKMYSEFTGLKPFQFTKLRTQRRYVKCNDIINPKIEFKSKELNELLTTLKNYTIVVGSEEDKFQYDLIYANNKFTIKLGGLHSADRPCEITPKEDEDLEDADVGSFYPSIVGVDRVCPKHLDPVIWNNMCTGITKERLQAKAEGRKLEADTLKIVVNAGLFGKYGDDYSWMKDVKAMYKVTINGQLYLLRLVENLHMNGIKIVSANTDGILCIVKHSQKEVYNKLCADWQKEFRFTLEFAFYKLYVRQDVNNYLAVTTKDKYKKKGIFVTDLDFDRGYNHPVVALALEAYYKDHVNIDTFLLNHLKKEKGIYDFCISQNVGSDFKNEFHHIVAGEYVITPVQKNVRYFVSTEGGTLMKRKSDGGVTSLVAGERVTLFNNYYASNDYKVRFGYYKAKILDIISKINGKHLRDIKGRGGKHPKSGISGHLFDELED